MSRNAVNRTKTNNMSILKKFFVKLGLAGLTSTGLVEKGRNNVTMLAGNLTYPTLQPQLPAITLACDELDAANQEVIFNGGKIAYEDRREKETAVRDLIVSLGEQVQVISAGDKAKILSAGFEVRRSPEPINKLEQPQDMRARLSGFSGTVLLDWEAVYGAHFYQVWMLEGDSLTGKWTLVGNTTKSRHTANDLTPGTNYSFRVNAVGARAESIYSDAATLMAA